jgi:aromatic-L-amino-acid decarboxylase
MKPDELRRALREDREQGRQPWLLFATAGTTNTGAVDPLEELGALAREEGLWFHVDGAYGGLFQLTQEGKGKLRGIDAADSIVIDPHKAFFLPYGVGACLVRDGHKLRATFLEEADYLADVQGDLEKSPTDYSPELTRHFRGMRVWLSLQTHGLGRMRNALEEKLELAKRFSDFVRTTPDLVLLDDPQLSVVVFHHAKGDGATRALLESLLARGKVHVSSTVIDGRFCLRACILSFRSHAEQLALLQSEVLTVLRS